jgi:hypothetical protein
MAAMPANEMTSGLKVVQERAIRFAKQNAEACFACASELANAKDIQDALAIQGRYAQTQMQAYALQAQELGGFAEYATQKLKLAAARWRPVDSRVRISRADDRSAGIAPLRSTSEIAVDRSSPMGASSR